MLHDLFGKRVSSVGVMGKIKICSFVIFTLFFIILDCRCLAQVADGEVEKTQEELKAKILQEKQTEESLLEAKVKTQADALKEITEEDPEEVKKKEGDTLERRKLRFKELNTFGHSMFDMAPSTFVPPTGVPVGPDYPLGPGDSLTIYIWGDKLPTGLIDNAVPGESRSTADRSNYRVAVSPQGSIFFPRVGVITVLGMTVEVLETELEQRLSEVYQTGVKLSVMLTNLRTITVFVIGEVQRPGSYSVNSLSTLFNALYVAGGPNDRGSMRNIKLMRNGETLDTVDLYRYLLEGDKSQDYRLQAGDTIFVPTAGMKVAVIGEVLRPAIYEFKNQVTMKEVIETAGGIRPSAYTQRIQLDRVIDNERILVDIDASKLDVDEESDIEILDSDTIFVFSVLDIYRNQVTILGNIRRPGIYELKPDMRVSQLLEESEGLLNDTYLDRAEIYRLTEDSTTEIIPFNLAEALNGKEDADFQLQNLDKIFIYASTTVDALPTVRIVGQVKNPDVYPLTPNVKVSDLIFRANGINPIEAYLERADLFRLKKDGSVIVIPVNVGKVLDGDAEEDIPLQESDQLVIYSKSELNKIPHVEIRGAVAHPGTYALASNMRIKDLFFIAGGLTKDAYTLRAELIRTEDTGEIRIIPFNPYSLIHENNEQESLALRNYDKIIVYLKTEAERKKYVEVSGEVQLPGTYVLLKDITLKDLIFKAGGVKNTAYLKSVEVIRIMPDGNLDALNVNLESLLNGDESQNIPLQENDQVYVRRIPGWSADRQVELKGEVMFPGKYTISEYETLEELIKRAGDFKKNAYKGGMRLERKSSKVIQYDLIGDNLKRLFEKAEQDWYSVSEISEVAVGTTGLTQAVAGGISAIGQASPPTVQEAQTPEQLMISSQFPHVVPGEQSPNLSLQEGQGLPPSELIPDEDEYIKIPVDAEKLQEYMLEDEDIIVVPKRPSFVVVQGEVYNPGAFSHEDKKIDDYIEIAGGYTKFADKDRRFIIKANGTAVTKNLDDVQIDLGDLIIIPAKIKEDKTTASSVIRDVTSILASALTIGLIIVQITK